MRKYKIYTYLVHSSAAKNGRESRELLPYKCMANVSQQPRSTCLELVSHAHRIDGNPLCTRSQPAPLNTFRQCTPCTVATRRSTYPKSSLIFPSGFTTSHRVGFPRSCLAIGKHCCGETLRAVQKTRNGDHTHMQAVNNFVMCFACETLKYVIYVLVAHQPKVGNIVSYTTTVIAVWRDTGQHSSRRPTRWQ